jgi:diguanylate cyclase (GGDEF)-like protein
MGSEINIFAALVGLVVALSIPAVYYMRGYFMALGEVRIEAWEGAKELARQVPENSGVGEIPLNTLNKILSYRPPEGERETRRLLDMEGRTVRVVTTHPVEPMIEARALVQPAGRSVAVLEVRRTLQPLVIDTVFALIPGVFAGWLAFTLFRIFPLRTLKVALDEVRARQKTEERLTKSLSLFSATLESTADGILVEDSVGKAVVSNHRFIDMWGLDVPADRWRSNTEWWDVVLRQMKSPGDFLRARRDLRERPEAEENAVLELEGGRTFEWHSRPEWIEGEVVGRVWSFRDVSESKRAHALMSIEKQILELVISGAPIGQAMSVLARHIEELSGQMFCAVIFRAGESETLLEFAVGSNLPKSFVEELEKMPGMVPLDLEFARADVPVHTIEIPDIQTDPRWDRYRDYVKRYNVVPMSAVPIVSSGGNLLGLIVAHYRPEHALPSPDMELIRIGNNLASIAIERRQAELRLYSLAHFDTLTELPNRSLFHDRLGQAMVRANRAKKLTALMFLDLDRFKTINDSLGHEAGDLLLKTVAQRLRRCVREEDTVSRLGGDEFTVVVEEVGHVDDVTVVAQKILDVLSPSMMLHEHEVFVTVSIGIAVYPGDSENIDGLLKNADTAMYRAKEAGRNNFQFYSPEMNMRTLEYLEMENSLRRALERDEFRIYYQPKVELRSGHVVGMEALLRWERPDVGLVSPAEFIPILEETGLIVPVGDWLLREACARNKAWHDEGFSPLRVAVNLSPRQFHQHDLCGSVRMALEATGLDPGFLELEVTESLLMLEPEQAADILRHIQELGVTRVDVDDFGTGYSSLSYLKRFPITAVKIDQSFVRDIPDDEGDAAIAVAVIAMAHSLKLTVIAEGVENDRQLEFLRRRGCDEIQGFYFSRPLPASEFGSLLREHRTLQLEGSPADAALGIARSHPAATP